MGGKRRHAPGQRSAIHDDAADGLRGFADLLEIERQPAFEQDDRDGDRDHRPVDTLPKSSAGSRKPVTGPAMKPAASSSTMAGKLQPPGKPLRGNAGSSDDGKFENDVVHVCPLSRRPWRWLRFEQVLKLGYGDVGIFAPGDGALEAAL
jgi:hypothetical protein